MKKLTSFLLIFSLLFVSFSHGVMNNLAFAHNAGLASDPPGPTTPRIKVTVTIDSIHLNQNMDDGLTDLDYEGDRDAEMVVGHGIKQDNHEKVPGSFEYDHNYARVVKWNDENILVPAFNNHTWGNFPDHTFDPPIKIYEHEECSPMDEVYYYFQLTESDQSVGATVAEVGSSVASALLIPVAGWTFTGAALTLVGLATSFGGLNGDDSLGVDWGGQKSPGTYTATLSGDSGGGTIQWTITTTEVEDPNNECSGQQTSTSHVQLNQNKSVQKLASYSIKELKTVVKLASTSKMEKGVTDLSNKEFNKLKQETSEKTIKIASGVYESLISSADTNQKLQVSKLADKAKSLAAQKKYSKSLDLYEQAISTLTGEQKITKKTSLDKTKTIQVKLSADQIKTLYKINAKNEIIFSILSQTSQKKTELLKLHLDKAWAQYDEDKNQDGLKLAQDLDKKFKASQIQQKEIAKFDSTVKQMSKSIEMLASNNGIKKIELDKTLSDLDAKSNIKTTEQAITGLQNAEKMNKQNAKDFENVFSESHLDQTDRISKYQNAISSITQILKDIKEDFAYLKNIDNQISITNEKPIAVQPIKETIKTDETQSDVKTTYKVITFVIGGKHYPQSQFMEEPAHNPNCEFTHYHSKSSQVHAIDGESLYDPGGCGFGKVGSLAIESIAVSQEQINAFKAKAGFEP